MEYDIGDSPDIINPFLNSSTHNTLQHNGMFESNPYYIEISTCLRHHNYNRQG